MDRNRALSLALGLATIGMMILVGYAMSRTPPWLSPVLGLAALGALSTWLMVLRSPQAIPFPRPTPSDPTPPAKPDDGVPPGTGMPLVFLLIGIGCVLAMTPYALCSCAGGGSVVKANPEAANCIANKGILERECVLNGKTEADVDACIAQVRGRTECTDGGKP
jgi:hypothetical protein